MEERVDTPALARRLTGLTVTQLRRLRDEYEMIAAHADLFEPERLPVMLALVNAEMARRQY